ncbi:MAG: acetyl-CoA C-acyltransferase [Saprospiraceae bacterium]
MPEAFIVGGVRTPIGNFGGALSAMRTDDMAAHVLSALMSRHPQLDPTSVADVFMGCANQAGEDNRNVARMALLLAGLPYTVPGETINRLCASGMAAAAHAWRAVRNGEGDYYIAGGVEGMTRGPYVLSKSAKPFGTDAKLYDSSFGWRFVNPRMEALYGVEAMGETAENLAEMYGISREDQDAFATWSQTKAAAAREAGRFALEIEPVARAGKKGETTIFAEDEFIKPDTNPAVLAKLRPAFRQSGTVTAGNSSGLNDGAAAMLIASEEGVSRLGLAPLARIVSAATCGVEPRIMGIGPVEASRKALQMAGLSMTDMDVIELNEAFAAQALACIRLWGIDDADPRINPNGGAIALGHPLGMSGARLLMSAALELAKNSNKRYALCTMCIGVGQGYAVVLSRA